MGKRELTPPTMLYSLGKWLANEGQGKKYHKLFGGG